MFNLHLACSYALSTGSMSSLFPHWFIVYFALIAGGKDPQSNDQSHQEHLSRLMSSLEHHHVRHEHIKVFWADSRARCCCTCNTITTGHERISSMIYIQ